MPPVFGPVSPSPIRLKSCAGSSGSAVTPSVTTNSDTSGPSRYSSMTTLCPPAMMSLACASAAGRDRRDHDALAGREPVVLHHVRRAELVQRAPRPRPPTTQVRAPAVGTPAATMTSFANAFEPSSLRRRAGRAEAGDALRAYGVGRRPRPAAPPARPRRGRLRLDRERGDRAGVVEVDGGRRDEVAADQVETVRCPGCRARDQGGDRGVSSEAGRQSVFTAAGTQQEYAHVCTCYWLPVRSGRAG